MAQDQTPQTSVGTEISVDQAQLIGGGDCTIGDYIAAINQLKQAYDNLVDFTSYVIERVAGQP